MPLLCNRKHPLHYTTALNILASAGIDTNTVNIIAIGTNENYKGELIGQEPAAGTQITPSTEIKLRIGYSSAVDYMPYQFFYGLDHSQTRSDDWELRARTLMAPFDAAVIRSTSKAAREILTFSLAVIDKEYLKLFLSLYDFHQREGADIEELLRWFALLPRFHHWSGNADAVQLLINQILDCECEIIENVRTAYTIPDKIRTRLGTHNNRLGMNTISGREFSECDTGYEIAIRNVPDDEIRHYLPGGSKREKLESIIEFCMPGDMQAKVTITGTKIGTKIGRVEERSYLGYSTYV